MADPTAHQERLLWLAWQEKRGGSGKVSRFPTLREPCGCPASIDKSKILNREGPCPCQGWGWVPVDSLEATLEAIFGEGWLVNMGRKAVGQYLVGIMRVDKDGKKVQVGKEKTLNEAAILTLYRAVKGFLKGGRWP